MIFIITIIIIHIIVIIIKHNDLVTKYITIIHMLNITLNCDTVIDI